jgi:soluble lytic murein transglycosylase-like protein
VSGRITPAPPAATPALPPAAPVSRRVLGALRENRLIARARSVAGDVVAAAVRHSVDPLLLHAIILVESGYRSEAVSSAGARGLMQLMPDTGAQLGVRTEEHLHQSATNVEAGAKYLSWLHTRFEGKLPLVVAAYNAGPGAVQRHGGRVPPYPETRAYVDDVLWLYDELRQARDRRTHG